MSIVFSCPFCRNEMTVDSKRGGQRGKCPKCNHVLKVPMQSESNMAFFDGNDFFDSEHLNTLFADFLDENEDRIISQTIDQDKKNITLNIGTLDGRSQIVFLFVSNQENKDGEGEEWLTAFSFIGEITDLKLIIEAIAARELASLPTFSLNLNKENMFINLNCSFRLKDIDEGAFYDMTIKLAEEADRLERIVFQVDKN